MASFRERCHCVERTLSTINKEEQQLGNLQQRLRGQQTDSQHLKWKCTWRFQNLVRAIKGTYMNEMMYRRCWSSGLEERAKESTTHTQAALVQLEFDTTRTKWNCLHFQVRHRIPLYKWKRRFAYFSMGLTCNLIQSQCPNCSFFHDTKGAWNQRWNF